MAFFFVWDFVTLGTWQKSSVISVFTESTMIIKLYTTGTLFLDTASKRKVLILSVGRAYC